MEQKELGLLLQKLDRELRTTGRIDPKNRELIQRLSDDIRPILSTKTPTADHYRGLRERLSDAAAAFEVEHPGVGAAIENVIDALVRLNL